MRTAAGGQRSFDDLGTPLADVTFCVLDIETTGGDRHSDLITEIGMVKVRAGECLGTLQSLVNPGRAIPPMITVLTGITESMVVRAPAIEAVTAVAPAVVRADAPVEAQTVGRVVITSNISSMPEVAGQGACFVNPLSIEDIRAGIESVLNNDSYRISLIEKGFENTQRFEPKNIAKQYNQLYRELFES